MHLFCFGLSYTALTLAKQLLPEGWRVSGTCRTADKCESLRNMGITAYIFTNDLPLQEVWDLQTVTHILHSIPPQEDGDAVFIHHLHDLQTLPNIKWLGYLSTTGIYGDHQGAWVDENTPPNPPEGRAQRRVDAEKSWLQSLLPVHIFRLSGIYGDKRNVLLELMAGNAHRIYKKDQVFSRIHVEDIAQILRTSMAKPNPGSIYNCADDMPASQAQVVEYAAKLLGINPPPLINFADADLSPMAKSFWASNRRVKNELIKTELGVKLKYSSYAEGLCAILTNLAASSPLPVTSTALRANIVQRS